MSADSKIHADGGKTAGNPGIRGQTAHFYKA